MFQIFFFQKKVIKKIKVDGYLTSFHDSKFKTHMFCLFEKKNLKSMLLYAKVKQLEKETERACLK